MSIQSKTEHSLNDLIAISRDGKEFYDEAAAKVEDVELATVFRRIASVKTEIVSSLSSVVASVGGTPEKAARWWAACSSSMARSVQRWATPSTATWQSWKSRKIAY